MHTFQGKTVRVHYNSDLSGKVIFYNKDTKAQFVVDGDDFVAAANRMFSPITIEKVEKAVDEALQAKARFLTGVGRALIVNDILTRLKEDA